MFCDKTTIKISAGKGGDGRNSMLRAKYVPKGGPDGGDGGRGGDIHFCADENLNTLIELHTKKVFSAPNGEKGGEKKMHGKNAENLIIFVPIGTQIFDAQNNTLLADLARNNDVLVAAVGGRGGYGNAHFTTSVRQTPRFAELGEPGESRELDLELKLVADVGIIGLPSAGKSTLIAALSSARPKIGAYPFTTIVPNLGVAKLPQNRSLVLCDMPGLIEGASDGRGLGYQFLKHVARNRVLIHVLDISEKNAAENYQTIRRELEKYDPKLVYKSEIIAFSKNDLLGDDEELYTMITEDFCQKTGVDSHNILPISALTRSGLSTLLEKSFVLVEREKEKELLENPVKESDRIIFQPHLVENPKAFIIEKQEDGSYRITGKRIEQIVVMTDFSNTEAVMRVRDVLRKMGIETKLVGMGAEADDILRIGETSFAFQPNMFRKR